MRFDTHSFYENCVNTIITLLAKTEVVATFAFPLLLMGTPNAMAEITMPWTHD